MGILVNKSVFSIAYRMSGSSTGVFDSVYCIAYALDCMHILLEVHRTACTSHRVHSALHAHPAAHTLRRMHIPMHVKCIIYSVSTCVAWSSDHSSAYLYVAKSAYKPQTETCSLSVPTKIICSDLICLSINTVISSSTFVIIVCAFLYHVWFFRTSCFAVVFSRNSKVLYVAPQSQNRFLCFVWSARSDFCAASYTLQAVILTT